MNDLSVKKINTATQINPDEIRSMNRVTTTVTFDISYFKDCKYKANSEPLEDMVLEALYNLMYQFEEQPEGIISAKLLEILEYEYEASIEFTLESTKSITQNDLHQILEDSYFCLEYGGYCDCNDGNCGDCVDGVVFVMAEDYEFKSNANQNINY